MEPLVLNHHCKQLIKRDIKKLIIDTRIGSAQLQSLKKIWIRKGYTIDFLLNTLFIISLFDIFLIFYI